MNLSDLQRTLHQALASRRVGIPVALRVHWRLESTGADADSDLVSAAAALLSWGEQVFGSPPRWVISQNQDHALTVLATCAGGQTLHVTVAAAQRVELHLLVIGNRGIVRLEGAECFASIEAAAVEASDGQKQNRKQWAERIRRSRDAGGVLTTGVAQ